MKIKASYTKAAKEHILQMAVRKMFKDEFNKKHEELREALTVKAESMGDHEELARVVPEHLLKNLVSSSLACHYGNLIIRVDNYVALESKPSIRSIELVRVVYISSHKAAELVDSQEVKEFNKYVKTIDQAASEIETSLNSYRTYNKAVEALPWIEALHPDYMKSPVCNIVPISTINKVNEMMNKLQ